MTGMRSRRWVLKAGICSVGIGKAALSAHATLANGISRPYVEWGRGFEGQRKADLGNDRYLNPIMTGDHPDPTILRDGDDYYMTFSGFKSDPALIIWHSRDLVNWTPLKPALTRPIGSVFAVDLCKYNGRYYIYIPIIPSEVSTGLNGASGIYVIHADDINGPWSAPISLNISGYIDPAHVVGEDGRRYLFLSGISRVRLNDDGLATDGKIEHVYDGWKFPDTWVVEAVALEGPKLFRSGEYFYLVSAQGGTSGPPTGHMVIVARSKSVDGPWQNCPRGPIVRTQSSKDAWWSRGHATFVQGPAADWWMVYHGYENGFRTLGRQVLMEPVEWTTDDWPRAMGGDLSTSIPKPRGGTAGLHGFPLSDDFRENRFGRQWTFYNPAKDENTRVVFAEESMVLTSKGQSPADCSPVTCVVGDHAYEASVDVELRGGAEGGLLLFYNRNCYLGMGIDGSKLTTYAGGQVSFWQENAPKSNRLHLRIQNDHHIVTFFYSEDGVTWSRHGIRFETSGYNTNTLGDLLSLRPGLFAARSGTVRFRNFKYRAM